MLDENIALEVNCIGKAFKSDNEKLSPNSDKLAKEIFSLKNISFHLGKGEILGVIGNNGAGKSTLLKILSGIIKPDSGVITYRGKLSSILDIGSGFHPDLTGIDNVYMVARLIGYSNSEIDKMLEEIIDFSGLGPFMRTQVKHYSSGMFMRLAFSLYTTLKSHILILDEVLSVGDINFREKSSARIKEIAASGTTIIIASHEMKTIQSLCTHGLLLDGGIVKGFDTIQNIIDKYVEHDSLTAVKSKASSKYDYNSATTERIENPNKAIELQAAFVKATGKPLEADIFMDDELEVSFAYKKQMASAVILSAVIADKFGNNFISLSPYRTPDSVNFIDTNAEGRYIQSVRLPKGFFNQGIFSISFYLADKAGQNLAAFEKLLYFKIHKNQIKLSAVVYPENYSCPLLPIAEWQTTKAL